MNKFLHYFKSKKLVYFQCISSENFQSTSHSNISEVCCQIMFKGMLENIYFHYYLISAREMYWLLLVQCQSPKNRKHYLIKSRREIVSILDCLTTLSGKTDGWKGQEERRFRGSISSYDDSLWLSKFTWPGRLARYDIDWMQINVSKCRKSLQAIP